MRWGWDIDPLIKPNPSEPGAGKVLQYQPQMEQLIIRLYFFFVGLTAGIYNTELKFEQALRSHSINTIYNKTCFPYAWINHIVEPNLCLNPDIRKRSLWSEGENWVCKIRETALLETIQRSGCWTGSPASAHEAKITSVQHQHPLILPCCWQLIRCY